MSEIEHTFAARRRFLELNQLSLSMQLGDMTCEMLGWGYLGERWWRNYLHVHSFYEVCCAFDGAGVFRINGEEHLVRAGDLFVARPTEPHEIVSSEDAPLGIYYWSYILRNGPTDAANSDDRDLSALLAEFAHSPRWLSADTDAIQSTLTLLTDEIAARAPGYKRAIAALAAKLIVDTARATTPAASAPSAQLDERAPHQQVVAQITRYLRDNFARPVTIRDVPTQSKDGA
jgi:AraC-like ligand binding domain